MFRIAMNVENDGECKNSNRNLRYEYHRIQPAQARRRVLLSAWGKTIPVQWRPNVGMAITWADFSYIKILDTAVFADAPRKEPMSSLGEDMDNHQNKEEP